MRNNLFDVLIIGAGPAGYSAAIYTAQAGLKTIVFGIPQRSHITKGHALANYLGFSKPTTGIALLKAGHKQAKSFGAHFIEREIIDIQKGKNGVFVAEDAERNTYQAKAVIICSGLGFKKSGIANEKEFIGRGVSWCAVCDGFFFKKKKVAVIGHTNFAAEEALKLLSYTSDVVILSHGKDFEFSPKIKIALNENEIKAIKTPVIAEFSGKNSLEGIKMRDGQKMAFDGAFLALGGATASDFSNKLGINRTGPQNNFLAIEFRTGETNMEGVYAAGDCTGGNLQGIKSAAEGCNAAISVIKFIKGIPSYVGYSS